MTMCGQNDQCKGQGQKGCCSEAQKERCHGKPAANGAEGKK